MSWFSQTIDNAIQTLANTISGHTLKIDGAAVNGLSGTADSLAYKVHEIEKHIHNSEQVFGSNSGFVAADTPVKFTVIGGNNAWGTELHIHGGDVIESGSSTKKFDLNRLYIASVSTADKISVLEFLYGTAGADVTGTQVQSTAVFTRTGGDPMFVDGDKVIVTALTNSTGPIATEVYYVTSVVGSTFKLERLSGGADVTLGGTDGTFTMKKLTQTSLTKVFVSKAATTSSIDPITLLCPRVTCNQRLFVRAKSETGSTISVGFLLGLHTYTA